MKADTEIGLIAIFTVLGFSLGQMSETNSVKPFFDYFFTPVTTLAGAFFGAWYAFKLQSDKALVESRERDVKSANNAIFELARWYNKLYAFKKQFVEEHRESPLRYIHIMPAAGMALDKPGINYESLAFIFESSNPNILGTIALVEQDIVSTLDVILRRSTMHVEILQPAIERIENRVGTPFSILEIERELGVRHCQTLKMLTNQLIEGVDNCLSSLRQNIDLLRAATKSMYPGHAVVGMIDPPSVASSDP